MCDYCDINVYFKEKMKEKQNCEYLQNAEPESIKEITLIFNYYIPKMIEIL